MREGNVEADSRRTGRTARAIELASRIKIATVSTTSSLISQPAVQPSRSPSRPCSS